ncbi:hypothetical protein NK6_6457 [Bradyrhizobium diazoefficiens]|uniref:Uncharacterized protein n=1 Tax=Bradyrhizobium diazoefficiens TaxID=1355477 RepID=A0A0E4FVY7_9BRAD|nr:hypothetical protein NK6_6457 [Bradyrhizobium diazoefficiens]
MALLRDAVPYFNRRADLAFGAFDHIPCQFGNLSGA